MAWLAHDTQLPAWSWRLRQCLDRFADHLQRVQDIPDVNSLSDRQLDDIGVRRTDRATVFDREMAILRRKGVGPFV